MLFKIQLRPARGRIFLLHIQWKLLAIFTFDVPKNTLVNPIFLSSQEKLELIARDMCASFGTQRWIANLGHGIYPDMDPELVDIFIKAVQRYSAEK